MNFEAISRDEPVFPKIHMSKTRISTCITVQHRRSCSTPRFLLVVMADFDQLVGHWVKDERRETVLWGFRVEPLDLECLLIDSFLRSHMTRA